MDADPDPPPSSAPKRPKFKPKAPPRRTRRLVLPKHECSDDDGEAAQALLRKVNERLGMRGTKVEKKSSEHVESSHGAGSSSFKTTTNGKPKDGKNNEGGSSNLNDSTVKSVVPSSSIATKDRDIDEASVNDELESLNQTQQEYKEPWDYDRSYYPTILPWRQPYSGDPELVDMEEFEKKEYGVNKLNSALELGLMEEKEEPQMVFFKFPPSLPLEKQRGRASGSTKGKEKVESPIEARASVNVSNRCCSLEELPGGYMGKMLVYKSGAIKLKLGDTIFDVSSGTTCSCAQDIVVMNTKSKDCGMLGELNKQAVVTPDINSILDNINLT